MTTQTTRGKRTRTILQIGVALGGAAALFWLFRDTVSPPPKTVKIDQVRVHNVDDSQIESFDLEFDGIPFFTDRHEIHMGASVELICRTTFVPERVPTGAFMADWVVAVHPVGSPEEAWEQRDSTFDHHFMHYGMLHKKPPQGKLKLRPETYPPGDYEMRLYLKVLDLEGQQSAFSYLGKSFLTILPAT